MSLLKNRGHALAVMAVAGAATISAFGLRVQGQGKPACDANNGGITLPSGFCAQVVADNLGVARQMAVARNGDLYVALMTGGGRGQPERIGSSSTHRGISAVRGHLRGEPVVSAVRAGGTIT